MATGMPAIACAAKKRRSDIPTRPAITHNTSGMMGSMRVSTMASTPQRSKPFLKRTISSGLASQPATRGPPSRASP